MDTAEHIAERLLYLIVLEHSAMFGTESGDRGEVHAHKDTTCFSLVWVLQRPPARTLQNAIIDSQQVEKKEGRKQTEILLKKDFDVEVGLISNNISNPFLAFFSPSGGTFLHYFLRLNSSFPFGFGNLFLLATLGDIPSISSTSSSHRMVRKPMPSRKKMRGWKRPCSSLL